MNDTSAPMLGTNEAATILGITGDTLRQHLVRYPELRPARRFSGDDLLWTADDIERVRIHREQPRKGGRPPKPK